MAMARLTTEKQHQLLSLPARAFKLRQLITGSSTTASQCLWQQLFAHFSSSSATFPDADADSNAKGGGGVSQIKVVSYPPVPKPKPQDSARVAEDAHTERPLTREESRYLRDLPSSIPMVSYNVRVAPLPRDRLQQPQQEDDENKVNANAQEAAAADAEADFGEQLKKQLDSFNMDTMLARKQQQMQMQIQQKQQELPFPKLALPLRKPPPKVEYDLFAAIRQVQGKARCKFDETVEAHVRLGINPKRTDQLVRGGGPLPHGIGKTVRVAVFAEDAAANEARSAGADIVGGEELINEIKEGSLKIGFDKCIATPEIMPRLGKIGKILGPRGLMPNPKSGTVTNDVATVVKEAKRGRVDFKMDETAIVHAALGKVSFSDKALYENITAFFNALLAAKPMGLKTSSRYAGYIRTFTLSSTMGPGIRVSLQSLNQAAEQYTKLNS